MDPRTGSRAGSLLWIRNQNLEQFCIWYLISLKVWNTRLASRPLSVVAGNTMKKVDGFCVLMVFCQEEKLDVSMFTEHPDGLFEPKKHERRTCGARSVYCLNLCHSRGNRHLARVIKMRVTTRANSPHTAAADASTASAAAFAPAEKRMGISFE